MSANKEPKKPFIISTSVINEKTYYKITSENGLTFHTSDKQWRYRVLNDERKYLFYKRKEAIKMLKTLKLTL